MGLKLLVGISIFCFSSYSLAESSISKFWNKDFAKNLGCGPGGQIAEDDTWLSTALATSINSSSFFVLPTSTTSKVSDCQSGPPLVSTQPAIEFLAFHRLKVAANIASGSGSYLDRVVNLLDVPQISRFAYIMEIKQRITEIFPDEYSTPSHIYESLKQIADPYKKRGENNA